MFDRFTDRARVALTIARDEARGPNGTHLGAEYILLGLLGQECGAVQVIERLGIDVQALRRELEMQIDVDTHGGAPDDFRLRDDALRILELAMMEAGRGRDRYIGTEHLLAALLLGGESAAATILNSHGIALDRVRAELSKLVGPDGRVARAMTRDP